LFLLVLPLLALEWFVNNRLFDSVSYTNSISLDRQIAALDNRSDWKIVFIGSSEVRWGISPLDFDKGVLEASQGSLKPMPAFNFGIDGFSPGLLFRVLELGDFRSYFPEAEVIMVGINLAEQNFIADRGYQPGACGAMQRPVLTSSFGKDWQVDSICTSPEKMVRFASPFEWLGIFRYRSSLREYLLRKQDEDFIPMQSNGLEHTLRGYQPHRSIDEARRNFELSWDRRLEEKRLHPERFAPLDEEIWPRMINDHRFFSRWVELGEELGVRIVFFALPTSPLFFRLYDRRKDYARNSKLLRAWAEAAETKFLDLGIQDQLDVEHHYSDHRHLSQYGAPDYSYRLGAAWASTAALPATPESGI